MAILLEVVRGCRPWQSLREAGVEVSFQDGQWAFGAMTDPPLVICRNDLVEGIRILANDHDATRQWASFLLATSSLVDLSRVETAPGGDRLIEQLWELSFSES